MRTSLPPRATRRSEFLPSWRRSGPTRSGTAAGLLAERWRAPWPACGRSGRSLLGAVGGALLGGALGASTSVGPEVDISKHDRYWLEHYATRPYVPADADYADYDRRTVTHTRVPACRASSHWEDVEADLAKDGKQARARRASHGRTRNLPCAMRGPPAQGAGIARSAARSRRMRRFSTPHACGARAQIEEHPAR